METFDKPGLRALRAGWVLFAGLALCSVVMAQQVGWTWADADECPSKGTVWISSWTKVENGVLVYDVVELRSSSADGSFVCASVIANAMEVGIFKSPDGSGAPFSSPEAAVAAIPEPATVAQLGLGLALMTAVVAHVRRKSAAGSDRGSGGQGRVP